MAKLKKVLSENKDELEDNIGDIYWFLALLANGSDIDIDRAIDGVIKQNKTRFPVADVRAQHTNIYLGGKDKKYSS